MRKGNFANNGGLRWFTVWNLTAYYENVQVHIASSHCCRCTIHPLKVEVFKPKTQAETSGVYTILDSQVTVFFLFFCRIWFIPDLSWYSTVFSVLFLMISLCPLCQGQSWSQTTSSQTTILSTRCGECSMILSPAEYSNSHAPAVQKIWRGDG